MRFSQLDGQAIVLWGLGRETRALRAELQRRLPGARIAAVIDDQTPLNDARDALAAADVLVRSPGVSIYKQLIQEALERGLPVTTPTGLWLAERGGERVIGVTGTKGKSTTATVLTQLLGTVTEVELAGNIGRPVIELLDLAHDHERWVVLELSSYQVSDLLVGPEVALITNLFREHTDWHGSEARYRADKLRLFTLPQVRAAVYPLGDPEVESLAGALPGAIPFDDPAGWHLDANGAVRRGSDVILTPEQIPLRGRHNAQNVAIALAALEAAQLPQPALPEALAGLRPLPHRLQTVHDKAGVEWVDDSISTTPDSTIAALEAFAGRSVVLIAGGQERLQEFERLGEVIATRVEPTALVTLPDTGARLAAAARAHGHPEDRMSAAADMREATARALALAGSGAVVLLSPAAPSYNAYADFEERGADFAACARAVS